MKFNQKEEYVGDFLTTFKKNNKLTNKMGSNEINTIAQVTNRR
ncbi:MAG: hypothetical protein ACJASL_002186 [Paraglaciecola sp.]